MYIMSQHSIALMTSVSHFLWTLALNPDILSQKLGLIIAS